MVAGKTSRRSSSKAISYVTVDKFAGISAQRDKVAMNTANSPMARNVNWYGPGSGGFQQRKGVGPLPYGSPGKSLAPVPHVPLRFYHFLVEPNVPAAVISQFLVATDDGSVYVTVDQGALPPGAAAGQWLQMVVAGTPVTTLGPPLFTQWDTVMYMSVGTQAVPATGIHMTKWSGQTATALGTAFVDDYAAPTGGNMPAARFVAPWQERMWEGCTVEAGVMHGSRVRFSHPARPEDWATDDWIDVGQGGSTITGMAPMRDMLLVFKAGQTFAVLGSGTSNFRVVEVSGTVGCNGAWTRDGQGSIVFWDATVGVCRFDGSKIENLFAPLVPFIKDQSVNRCGTIVSDGDFIYALTDFKDFYASPVPTPPATPTNTMVVWGSELRRTDGTRVVIKGFEQYYPTPDPTISMEESITEMNRARPTGLRLLPNPGATDRPTTISEIKDAFAQMATLGVVVDSGINGGTDADVYGTYRTDLAPYEPNMVIHHGESYAATDAEWGDACIAFANTLRAQGWLCPIMHWSRNGGRNWTTIKNQATRVMAADPANNTGFGVQLYWSGDNYTDIDNTTDYYQELNGNISLRTAVNEIAAAPYYVQVGLCTDQPDLVPRVTPWRGLLDYIETSHPTIPWLWWGWSQVGSGTMTMMWDYAGPLSNDTTPPNRNVGVWNYDPTGVNDAGYVAEAVLAAFQPAAKQEPLNLRERGADPLAGTPGLQPGTTTWAQLVTAKITWNQLATQRWQSASTQFYNLVWAYREGAGWTSYSYENHEHSRLSMMGQLRARIDASGAPDLARRIAFGKADPSLPLYMNDMNDDGLDHWGTTTTKIDAYYMTPWLHGGLPGQVKRWKAPRVIQEADQVGNLLIDVFYDFNYDFLRRTLKVGVLTPLSFDSYSVGKPGTIGRAKAVMLVVRPEDPRHWGVSSMTIPLHPKVMR